MPWVVIPSTILAKSSRLTEMQRVDVVVIGGGVLGCFAARHLRRWHLETLLVEAEEDVGLGITRANSAIVYSGCDNKTGSLKARMTVAANAHFADICEMLDVPFARPGSLMIASSPEAEAVLRRKMAQGQANGVPHLALLNGDEARALEPMLAADVRLALYAPTTGTVNPWQLSIAAYENALQNGARAMLGTRVQAIVRDAEGYVIETDRVTLRARAIINAAGLSADRVQELVFPPSVRLQCDAADYYVMDKAMPGPRHVLFQERADGKGVTMVPTVEKTLLVEGPPRPLTDQPWATSVQGLEHLRSLASTLMPAFDAQAVIRSFAAMRPNPYLVAANGKRLNDFVIAEPAETFLSFIGIKTPGLTCADALGTYAAERLARRLEALPNAQFNPRRIGIHERDDEIICQCEQISKAEILAAISRGARTVDGVKHRVGAGLGRCQGARCRWRIEELLEAKAHDRV